MLTSDHEDALRTTIRSIADAALRVHGGSAGASNDWNRTRESILSIVRQELAASVHRHNSRVPVMRLRDEELEVVFSNLGFHRRLRVMLVCRSWYHAIVTSPRLWNEYSRSAGGPCPTPATLSRFMERSRAAPLVLMFCIPSNADADMCAAYWAAVSKHVHHMSRLLIDHGSRLVSTWREADINAALTRPAPKLDTLGLTFAKDRPFNLPDNLLAGSPVALRNMQLWNVNFPTSIPGAWANLIEFLYAAPEVKRSGILALYSCCPRLAVVTISVVNYRLDCDGDSSINPSIVSLRIINTTVLDETIALLNDARHDSIPMIMYKNGPPSVPPFWPSVSQHRFTRASMLSYFTADEIAQLEFCTERDLVRQTFRVPATDVWEKLYDATFLAHLVELEIAEEFWPMERLPEAPNLLTLTFVVGPRVGRFNMTEFRSNFLFQVSGKKLGRLVCPKLRSFVLTVPTRMIEYENGADLPPIPPLRGDVIQRMADKLSVREKLEEIVFKGLTVDDESKFSYLVKNVRYAAPSPPSRPALPGGVFHSVTPSMSAADGA